MGIFLDFVRLATRARNDAHMRGAKRNRIDRRSRLFLPVFLGLYTAPTDEALAYDIEAVPMFGLNMIRLHQKVNPERWYYHADKIGVAIFQDMVQK